MTDATLFTAGSLFTSDYLTHGIADTAEYAAVDPTVLSAALAALFDVFPTATQPNEAQTEDDLIWPVLAALGGSDVLRQQNLTVSGREDVPDGLMFADAAAKAQANAGGQEWQRYAYGLAVESKRWGRPTVASRVGVTSVRLRMSSTATGSVGLINAPNTKD